MRIELRILIADCDYCYPRLHHCDFISVSLRQCVTWLVCELSWSTRCLIKFRIQKLVSGCPNMEYVPAGCLNPSIWLTWLREGSQACAESQERGRAGRQTGRMVSRKVRYLSLLWEYHCYPRLPITLIPFRNTRERPMIVQALAMHSSDSKWGDCCGWIWSTPAEAHVFKG